MLKKISKKCLWIILLYSTSVSFLTLIESVYFQLRVYNGYAVFDSEQLIRNPALSWLYLFGHFVVIICLTRKKGADSSTSMPEESIDIKIPTTVRKAASSYSSQSIFRNYDNHKLWLSIPYEDKEFVKREGARWDANRKKWYSTDRNDYYAFRPWLDYPYIIFDKLYILESTRKCWKCRTRTPVIAFGFETAIDISTGEYIGDFVISPSIDPLPRKLKNRLRQEYNYYEDYGVCVNHCIRCGVLQGNYYLHEEIDSPFLDANSPEIIWFCIDLLDDISVDASLFMGNPITVPDERVIPASTRDYEWT